MQPSHIRTTAFLCFALNEKTIVGRYKVLIRVVSCAVIATLGRLIKGNCKGVIDGYVLSGSCPI